MLAIITAHWMNIAFRIGANKNYSHTVYDMNARLSTASWDGVERRSPNSCRRRSQERRMMQERRRDPRNGASARRSLTAIIKSFTHGRLGVDRRKGFDQRLFERRCSGPRSLLSQEELDALLK